MDHVVIVGGGQAGMRTAIELRDFGHLGPITILGSEAEKPYERPPLSKGFLTGETLEPTWVASEAQADSITFKSASTVCGINKSTKTVQLEDGSEVGYDALVLATGGTCRQLTLGADIPVYDVRTVQDAQRLRQKISAGGHLTIIGAGVIGLEVAASAKKCGMTVSIIELGDRLMGRNLPDNFAPLIKACHDSHGIEFHMSDTITSVIKQESRYTVQLGSGNAILTDCLISGIGITPNTALAEQAGLNVQNGVSVGPDMRTSDPHIFAVGDIASVYSDRFARRERVETWDNANKTAKIAAAAIVRAPLPPLEAPWFWSDQYDINLQVAGWPMQADETIWRKTEQTTLALYLLSGALIGAAGINAAADVSAIRRMLNAGISPSRDDLANTSMKLRSLLRARNPV